MLPFRAHLTHDDDLKQRNTQAQRHFSSEYSLPLQSPQKSSSGSSISTGSQSKPDIIDLGLHIVGVGFKQKKINVYQEPIKRQRRKSIDIDQFQFLNFDKDQPPSNEIVEDLFDQLLLQRSFSNDIKVNLRSVSLSRKWALICQDQNNHQINQGTLIRSPEWFTSKIKHLDSKELHKLERYLRDKEFTYKFFALEGHIGLMDLKMNTHNQEVEFLLICCYKNLVNSPKGTDIISQDFRVIKFLINTMLKTQDLNNKKLITDILILISYWVPPLGRNNILKAFNNVSELNMFKDWIDSLTMIMNKGYTAFTKLSVKDLMLSSLFLMVVISEGSESLNDQKIIYYKFKEAGIYSLFYLMQQIDDEYINEQIKKFKAGSNTTFASDISDELHLEDSQISIAFKSIKSKIANNDALTDTTTKLLKTLLDILMKTSKTEALNMFKFIESIISSITSTKSLSLSSESVINASIQRLMDRLITDDIAQRVILEVKELEEINQELENEVSNLKESLTISNGDILERNQVLQTELEIKNKEIKLLKSRIEKLEELRAADQIKENRKTTRISFNSMITTSSSTKNYQEHAATLVKSINQRNADLAYSKKVKGTTLVRSKCTVKLPFFQSLNVSNDSVESFEKVDEQYRENVATGSSSWKSVGTSGTSKLTDIRSRTNQKNLSGVSSFSGTSNRLTENAESSHATPSGFTTIQSNRILCENSSTNGPSSFSSSTGSGSSVSFNGAKNESQRIMGSPLSMVSNGPHYDLLTDDTLQLDMKSNLLLPSISKLAEYDSHSHFTGTSSSSIPTPPPLSEMFSSSSSCTNEALSNHNTEPHSSVAIPNLVLNSIPSPPPLPEMFTSPVSTTSSMAFVLPTLSPSEFLKVSVKSAPHLSKAIETADIPTLLPPVPSSSSPYPPPPPPPPPPTLPDFLNSASKSASDSLKVLPQPPPPPSPLLPVILKAETESNNIMVPSPSPSILAFPNKNEPPKMKMNIKPAQDILTQTKIDEISMALYKPSKKLKQLHWDKVEEVENTLWNDKNYLPRTNELQALGILREVEDLFDVKATVRKQSPIRSVAKVELISFLPRDLSQQFGINLHMFANLSEEELIEKVLKCDDDILNSVSVLEFFNREELCEISSSILKNFKPYITDYQKNKTPEKDSNMLERADRLYLELCINLRHYWRSRSRALLILGTYEKDYYDLLGKLQRVDDSVKAIKESKSLKHLFMLIREIGNFMNRKQVEGFKLVSLQKFSFIKDHNQNTFLHYVENVIRKSYPEYLSFLQELSVLQDSSKISIEQLSHDIHSLLSGVKNIEKSMEIGNLSDPRKFHPFERVLNKLTPKLPEAKKKCMLLENQHKYVLEDFESVMKYFGENSKDAVARSTFLQSFQDFINDFERVQKDNLEAETKKKIYEKRKEIILQNQPKTKNSRAKLANNASEIEEESDVIENLLKRLKGVSSDRKRISTSGSSLQRRESSNDNELLTRAQTMLEGTKRINV